MDEVQDEPAAAGSPRTRVKPATSFQRARSMPLRLALALAAGRTSPVTAKRAAEDVAPPVDARKADAQAGRYGATLSDAVDGSRTHAWSLPGWSTADRPGWRTGGDLGLTCESCDVPLRWADWWNAGGCRMRNNAFVYCQRHGGPVTRHKTRDLQPLVRARQQLDSALFPPKPADEGWRVYAFDVLDLAVPAVYVGETSQSVPKRYEQHLAGGREAAAVVRNGPGRAGGLRHDLFDHVPLLRTHAQSLSAQHWLHLSLVHQGFKVYGDGKR